MRKTMSGASTLAHHGRGARCTPTGPPRWAISSNSSGGYWSLTGEAYPASLGPLARPAARAGTPHAAQPLDEHGVVRERGLRVDERVEHLVVLRGAHAEEFADGVFLGPGVAPPLTFEGEDFGIALAEHFHPGRGRRPHCIAVHGPPFCASVL